MKKLIVITALLTGLLLLLIPRYILPACEYLGHPAMHCSDTARAEYFVGALFIVFGGSTAFFRSRKAELICAVGSIILSIAAFLLPDKIGYCHSTQMPCNYGMVPGVRFVAVVSAIIMVIGLVGTVQAYKKKGSS